MLFNLTLEMDMIFTNGVLTVLFQLLQRLAENFEQSVGEVVGRFAYCSVICHKTSENAAKFLSE
jgi:hypothetical protein